MSKFNAAKYSYLCDEWNRVIKCVWEGFACVNKILQLQAQGSPRTAFPFKLALSGLLLPIKRCLPLFFD